MVSIMLDLYNKNHFISVKKMSIEDYLIQIGEKYPYAVNNIHKLLTEGYYIVDNMDGKRKSYKN